MQLHDMSGIKVEAHAIRQMTYNLQYVVLQFQFWHATLLRDFLHFLIFTFYYHGHVNFPRNHLKFCPWHELYICLLKFSQPYLLHIFFFKNRVFKAAKDFFSHFRPSWCINIKNHFQFFTCFKNQILFSKKLWMWISSRSFYIGIYVVQFRVLQGTPGCSRG